MTDRELIGLFCKRDESVLEVCRERFGPLMRLVASRVVGRNEAGLAENSAYLDAWNTIPPKEPESLASYLAMLTRRRAVDMLRMRTRSRRGGGEYEASVEELSECVPSPVTVEEEVERNELRDALDRFLEGLPKESRVIFMRRYWWFESIADIARDLRLSRSAVKMRLSRTREKLKDYLEKEGFEI